MKHKQEMGFTLLELMIAVAIFGFMLLGISQVLRQQITQYQANIQQDKLEQDARKAMLQILDQIHLHAYKIYAYGLDKDGNPILTPPGSDIKSIDSGNIYFNNVNPNDPDNPGTAVWTRLIDVNPNKNENGQPILSPGDILFYDGNALKYIDDTGNYLVADDIIKLTISPDSQVIPVDNNFVKIDIVAQNSANQSFELVSWARLH